MSKELHSSSISLAPGDFKLLVDFIAGEGEENAVIGLGECGLDIRAGASSGVVSFNTGNEIEDEAKQFVWVVPIKALSRIANVIPMDSFYWASQRLNLEMDLDKYLPFIGHIRDSDWKKEQDLWIKDREYRKLVAQKDDVDSHLMRLCLQLYDDQIELWIDVNEVCAVVQLEIKCDAVRRT